MTSSSIASSSPHQAGYIWGLRLAALGAWKTGYSNLDLYGYF